MPNSQEDQTEHLKQHKDLIISLSCEAVYKHLQWLSMRVSALEEQNQSDDEAFRRGVIAGVRWMQNLPDENDLERAREVIESRPEVEKIIKQLNREIKRWV